MTVRMTRERLALLRRGCVIPASPLALTEDGAFSPAHQRAVYRYYAAAGAGGVAVGVHTTQFEIRDPEHRLFQPVLELAAHTLKDCEEKRGTPLLRDAGVCGKTAQAVVEAELARDLEYDAALLSLAALRDSSEDELVAHCREIAGIIPVIGFYLQPAVGGRPLPFTFWRRFAEIDNVVAIKIAPFNRYQTIDVVRGVALAGREQEIALYTGNDDNIIADLLTPFSVYTNGERKVLRICGGLLGQWSVYTKSFVDLLDDIHHVVDSDEGIPPALLRRNAELTDANAVIFDAANGFAGCIPGINEVLRRQGLLPSSRCLDPHLELSPGQAADIDRIEAEYTWLPDHEFISAHRDEWFQE
jgi:dihydrodipicolinate synthase/N-acetylneuraminate lyase